MIKHTSNLSQVCKLRCVWQVVGRHYVLARLCVCCNVFLVLVYHALLLKCKNMSVCENECMWIWNIWKLIEGFCYHSVLLDLTVAEYENRKRQCCKENSKFFIVRSNKVDKKNKKLSVFSVVYSTINPCFHWFM